MISKQAKQLEKEIKELDVNYFIINLLFTFKICQDEIISIKNYKSGQIGVEKNTLLNELKSKTQRLIQKQDKFESQYRKKADEFKEIKTKIHNLYINIECSKETTSYNKLMIENGINENNVKIFLAQIETKIKNMLNFFKMEKDERFEVIREKINKYFLYIF